MVPWFGEVEVEEHPQTLGTHSKNMILFILIQCCKGTHKYNNQGGKERARAAKTPLHKPKQNFG